MATPEKKLNLVSLRERISKIDDQILGLIQERMETSRQVGQLKKLEGLPIKDYAVEKQIIEKVRGKADRFGFYEDLGEEVFKSLIEYSCLAQEELMKGTSLKKTDSSQFKVLILGGKGQMGQWFCNFFHSLGHEIEIWDPESPKKSIFPEATSLVAATSRSDIVVLASPLDSTPQVLEEIIKLDPPGVLVDICSLKSPVLGHIDKAYRAGLKMASIHPMFGPTAKSLVGRNIIICESPACQGNAIVEQILSTSSAKISRIPLAEHDLLMSYILGASHLLNLLFAGIVEKSTYSLTELAAFAGTTFRHQLKVTEDVIAENQDLYFDIQALNEKTPELFASFKAILLEYEEALKKSDRTRFKGLMNASAEYFQKSH